MRRRRLRSLTLLCLATVGLLGASVPVPRAHATQTVTGVPRTATLVYFKAVDESTVPRLGSGDHARAQTGGTSGAQTSFAKLRGFDAIREVYGSNISRPDMGLAPGPAGVLEVVNSEIGAYTADGRRLAGWPKGAAQFFGLPFSDLLADPRAVYDQWSRRYFVAFGDQERDKVYFLAVSATEDPRRLWYVYGFKLSDERHVFPDFIELGVDADHVSIATNLLRIEGGRSRAFYSGIYTIDKASLERGDSTVAAQGFTHVEIDGGALGFLQPVTVPDPHAAPPPGELFAAGNISGPDCSRSGCSGVNVVQIIQQGSAQQLAAASAPTVPYSNPPPTYTPACPQTACLTADGPFFLSPPVYRHGLISFALNTAVNNGAEIVPGILWGQIRPSFGQGSLQSVASYQSGIVSYDGGRSAFDGTVMTDAQDALYLVYFSSSTKLNPSLEMAARRKGDPLNRMTALTELKRGRVPPPLPKHVPTYPWGDYCGASLGDAAQGGGVWLAGQYARSAADYGTYIANVRL